MHFSMLGDRLTVGHLPLTQTVQVRILVAQPIVSTVKRTEVRSLPAFLRAHEPPVLMELLDGRRRNKSRQKFGKAL